MWDKFKAFFRDDQPAKPAVKKPKALDLSVGMSFKLDPLMIKMILSDIVVDKISPEQIIHAAGTVDMDGVTLVRLYTDDDAWLQVVFDGSPESGNIIDVMLFHYYETLSINSDTEWDNIFKNGIAKSAYSLEKSGKTFVYTPVWHGTNGTYAPIRLEETCYDDGDEPSRTLQCAMLYERKVREDGDVFEMLFVAAEKRLDDDSGDRCLVLSTGIKLAIHDIEA